MNVAGGELHSHVARAIAESACRAGPTLAGLRGHDVQLYRTDAYLTRAVVDFLVAHFAPGSRSL